MNIEIFEALQASANICFLPFLIFLHYKAEKFGDSFVFEGLLSETVKNQITQAVSTII